MDKAMTVFFLLLALLAWLALRRWAPGAVKMSRGRSHLLEVTERLALDPKKHLYVVKAAGEYVLVGASDAGIHLVKVLDPAAFRVAAVQPERLPGVPPRRLLSVLVAVARAAAGRPHSPSA